MLVLIQREQASSGHDSGPRGDAFYSHHQSSGVGAGLPLVGSVCRRRRRMGPGRRPCQGRSSDQDHPPDPRRALAPVRLRISRRLIAVNGSMAGAQLLSDAESRAGALSVGSASPPTVVEAMTRRDGTVAPTITSSYSVAYCSAM